MRGGLAFLAVWIALVVALVMALLIGSGTLAFGYDHLETSGTHYFPGAIQTGPTVFSSLGLGAYKCSITQNLGVFVYCKDCQGCGADCTGGGTGAQAECIAGEWTCFGPGSLCGTGGSCVNIGDPCVTTCQCCEGACMNGVCVNTLQCSDLGTTCDICGDVAGCLITTTSTSSTTTSSTTTTTTSTVSTTTGAGTTTTTTSTTTTTIVFGTVGFTTAQNFLVTGSDDYEANGNTDTTPVGTPIILPATGTAHFLGCGTDVTPNQADPSCNGTSVPCPIWTVCLQQSNSPFDESNFSDTSLCCTMGNVSDTCADTVHTATIFQGAFLTIHLNTNSSFKPGKVGCSVEVRP